jgi:DinB family protein
MGRTGIELLLYMMDRNFAAPGPTFGTWHSFLVNLADVRDEDWLWVPEGGERTIFQIVQHAGETKYVYDSCAFGDSSVHWQRAASVPSIDESTPRDEVVRWLQAGHQQFHDHVAALEDDSELSVKRPGLWNDEHETRWLVTQVIQHDLYHAGELNHIRALRHKNDEWGNEP